MRAGLLMCAAALLAGCGYVGDPMPPALNIPVAVTDLRVVQRGDKLILDFTAPAMTTDEMALTSISVAEIRVGQDAVPTAAPKPGTATHIEIPARQWTGREAPISIVLTGPKAQRSSESNVVTLKIDEPLPVPSNVKAEPHAEGVKVSWAVSDARATKYRVQRNPPLDITVDKPEFIDRAVEIGKTYKYLVIALRESAESLPSEEVSVVPRDVFPPAAPVNLNAIAGVNTIELNWDRSLDADLKSYRVYRNDQVIVPDVDAPSFSDKQVTSGERYRYAVTAIDQAGNESAKSAMVEIAAP